MLECRSYATRSVVLAFTAILADILKRGPWSDKGSITAREKVIGPRKESGEYDKIVEGGQGRIVTFLGSARNDGQLVEFKICAKAVA